jgi:hypothetical protein
MALEELMMARGNRGELKADEERPVEEVEPAATGEDRPSLHFSCHNNTSDNQSLV